MAATTITGLGDGTAPTVNITFPFLSKDHVKARIDQFEAGLTWTGTSQVTFNVTVPSGSVWTVYRSTSPDVRLVDFGDASPLTEDLLDTDSTQHFYREQEIDTLASSSIRGLSGETLLSLPPAAKRGSKFLQFAADGLSLLMLSGSDIASAIASSLLTLLPNTFKGDPGSAGEGFPNRAAMAAYVAANGDDAYLTEAGREGKFIFRTANYSTAVSSDPQQGMYVAPASDPTGASGAWVRQLEGKGSVSVKWFGAKGDNVTNDAGAFLAALAFLRDAHQGLFNYGFGTYGLFIPLGFYYLGTTTLDLYGTIHIHGEDPVFIGGASAVLRWDPNTTGIRVQRENTSGASGSGATGYPTGAGSTIERLGLQGGYNGVEGDFHGIHLRSSAIIRDVAIRQFPGDGIYGRAQAGGGGALEGLINLSHIERVWSEQNRNGMYFEGADANAMTIKDSSVQSNRQWGILDNSFLGNFYSGLHAAANGAGAYQAARAQLNSACSFRDCYSESGQPASIFAPKTLVTGGFHAAGASGGGFIGAADDKLLFGPATVQGALEVTDVATFDLAASFPQGFSIPGKLSIDANGDINSFGTVGISLNGAGAGVHVGGSQVVGARQGATPAPASDLATVIALANRLREQLIAHGLIG